MTSSPWRSIFTFFSFAARLSSIFDLSFASAMLRSSHAVASMSLYSLWSSLSLLPASLRLPTDPAPVSRSHS